MLNVCLRGIGCIAAAIASLGLGAQALGQVNLAGQWTGQYHEDQPDRLPGPELGDYGG